MPGGELPDDIRFALRQAQSQLGFNLWNIIVDDFLEKSFGPAKQPMGQFYALIEGSNKSARLVFDDVLARMFRLLGEAQGLAADDRAVLRRIDDLILYSRYCELFDG